MEKTGRQILAEKEVLTAKDIVDIFGGVISVGKAYDYVKAVNAESGNPLHLKGKCLTRDFILHLNLNPSDYGRTR